jgi:hypothetical protein
MESLTRVLFLALALNLALVQVTASVGAAPDVQGPPDNGPRLEVDTAENYGVSAPLRTIPPRVDQDRTRRVRAHHRPIDAPEASAPDTVVQSSATTTIGTTSASGFDGIGKENYNVRYAPPDTTGAVGLTQYVQMVNAGFVVIDKTPKPDGTANILYGPADTNTLWADVGGVCAQYNHGDPMVVYDKVANRWILTQFALPGGSQGYYECVAVSMTPDATGGYYRYAFKHKEMNDYPKLSVWPDAYYVTYNMFRGGVIFIGAKSCALEREKMLQGLSARQVCFQLSNRYHSLLPADVDGASAPPAGSPNPQVRFASGALQLWNFKVNWANTGSSSLTGPTNITVAGFTQACGQCVPQPGTANMLDTLSDRLMNRLAYRNFGTHQSMVVNHSVAANNAVGVRWYELRKVGTGQFGVHQQGTYAPADGLYRWMGSAAMDRAGNIAVGYSRSGTSLFPSIAYAARNAGDPLGTLSAETTIINGTGSQTGTLHRWGDYSAMTVDPVDDCTFWYTNEYLTSNGTWNWSTRIASFKLASCV